VTSFYIVTSYYTKYTKVFFPLALSNFISVLNIAEELMTSRMLRENTTTRLLQLVI
jgi:hypothetical protein